MFKYTDILVPYTLNKNTLVVAQLLLLDKTHQYFLRMALGTSFRKTVKAENLYLVLE